MAHWIFQGNPDKFDIERYLAATKEALWLVRRYRDDIQEGDTVFLWKNKGTSGQWAGIIALATVDGPVADQPDKEDARPFWMKKGEASTIKPRVPLLIGKVVDGKNAIRRDQVLNDPELQDLPNIKQPQGTNYPLESRHAERLAALWSKIG